MAFAKEHTTDKIRNVAVLGHGGAGKTSLIDALCYTAGSSRRKGNIDEGHALTMYTPEEASHGISLQCTPAFCEYSGTKINLLDTPGFMDFIGETLAAIRVADSAVIVVSATSGVEVGTETVWEYAEDRGVPRFFFVSMMDKDHASFERVYQDIKARLTEKVVPVEIPIGEGADFRGIINLFSERAHIYKAGTEKSEYDEVDVPEELQAKFEEWETELQETLATTDEVLLDRYLEEGKITGKRPSKPCTMVWRVGISSHFSADPRSTRTACKPCSRGLWSFAPAPPKRAARRPSAPAWRRRCTCRLPTRRPSPLSSIRRPRSPTLGRCPTSAS